MKLSFFVFFIVLLFLTRQLIFQNEMSYLTLDDRPRLEVLGEYFNREIFHGRTIAGEFKSNFDHLGVVGIRFEPFNRINTDTLEFRIKEKGSNFWYYAGRYKTDQFQSQKIFPFGFPPIVESKGKTYLFELESLGGQSGDGVGISLTRPNFIGRHVFTREMLWKNSHLIPRFLGDKVVNLYEYPDFAIYFISYAAPLFFLVLFRLTNYSIIAMLLAILLLLQWDIFVNQQFYDYFLIAVSLGWLLTARKHRLSPALSAAISIFLLTITAVATIVGRYLLIEKTTIWAITFILLALVQQISQYRSVEDDHGHHYLLGRISLEVQSTLSTISSSFRDLRNKTYSSTQLLVVFITVSVALGYYLWFVLSIIHQFSQALSAYRNYFPSDQFVHFVTYTGVYIFSLYAIAITTFTLLARKSKTTHRLLLAAFFLPLTLFLQTKIIAATDLGSAPIIWKVRGYALREPWVDIFVDGRNFHESSFPGQVLVNGIEHRIIKWDDREIIFRTDPYKTRSGKLEVIRDDGLKSNTIEFLYYGNR